MKQILKSDIVKPSTYVATMGYFDGVHLGHQYLLSLLQQRAYALGKPSLVITFDNHPKTIVAPSKAVPLLTTTQEKLLLLEKQNVDACALLRFTRDIAMMTAKEFMKNVLVDWLGVDTLIVGYDHRFGHDRREGFSDYVAYGQELGLNIEPAFAMKIDGNHTVSSSEIREALRNGDVSHASMLLSRPYFISGTVIEGKQLGRTLGFPTANLLITDPNKLIPKDGVYAVNVVVNDQHRYKGIMNIGTRPTLNDGRGRSVEIHLLGFSGSLYGAKMNVELDCFLRDERKFGSLQELKEQITIDKDNALKHFRL